jgi:hypothetical protein
MRGANRLAALLAALAVAAIPSGAWADERRHPLVPDHAKLQFAGAVGLVSAGGGYAFARRHLELDALVGWVPASIADVDLLMVTGKLTFLPWKWRLPHGWRLRPVTSSLALTYTFGDRFFLRSPDKYPTSDYYPLPTALRGTVALGATLGRAVRSFEELGVFVELVAVDIPLAFWVRNQDAVRASDVISVALGLRAEF